MLFAEVSEVSEVSGSFEKKIELKKEIHPSHPSRYSCFKHDNDTYTCIYDDFKTVYFNYRFTCPLDKRRREIIIDVPFYIPEFCVSTYLATKLSGNPLTEVNMKIRLPSYKKDSAYSQQWQPLIDEGKCYVKNCR